jgi:hypothetical protein
MNRREQRRRRQITGSSADLRRRWWIAGSSAGLLLTVLAATVVPGLALAAVLAVLALPVVGWAARRRAATRRLALRNEAAPAVLDLLGAALLAGLNPHKAVLRVADRAPEVLQEDLGLAAAVLRLGGRRRPPWRPRSGGVRHRPRRWPPGRRPSAAAPASTPRPKQAEPPSASSSRWSSASCPPSFSSSSSRPSPVRSEP